MALISSTEKVLARPKHISESLLVDFDMFNDSAYKADPHTRIMQLLAEAPPVFWTPHNGGHWVALAHQAVFDAARDPAAFSSELIPHSKIKLALTVQKCLAFLGFRIKRIPVPYPILIDPPMHGKYRQPLQAVFSPKNVSSLEGRLRAAAVALIEKVADQGRCEFMAAIAEPLPVQLFLQLLGLPVEKMPEYRALLKKHMSAGQDETDSRKKLETLQAVVEAMRGTLVERREHPRDDIISHLWRSEIDGQPMTLEDMENYGVLLFIAGLDTVMQAMGYAIRHLAMDQALQQQLRSEPGRIGGAIEELLRRYTFALPPRRATRDMNFCGAPLKKNDTILLFLHGANLDPARFDHPEQVNLDREDKTHITFNAGPHRCLGSHLARMELRILIEEFLARVPTFKLDPDLPVVFDCGYVVGIETLGLVWE